MVAAQCTFVIRRQIAVDAGHELSLQYGCQFYEVSAAESGAGVALAFQSLLREARSVQLLRALPIRRKLGVNSVSKVHQSGGMLDTDRVHGKKKKRSSLIYTEKTEGFFRVRYLKGLRKNVRFFSVFVASICFWDISVWKTWREAADLGDMSQKQRYCTI